MLRTIQLHCDACVRTEEIDLQAPRTIRRNGQLRVDSEPTLRCRERLESPEEKSLGGTARALRAIRVGWHCPRHMNEETGER